MKYQKKDSKECRYSRSEEQGNASKNKQQPPDSIYPTVEENLNAIKDTLGSAIGLVENSYNIFGGIIKSGLAYIEFIADKDLISQNILIPLLNNNVRLDKKPDDIISTIQTDIIPASKTYITSEMEQVIGALLNGDTVFFVNNSNKALIIGSRKFNKRPIEKPVNESTVLGSQESFTDNLDTNMSLIIKRLPVKELHFKSFTVGRLSHNATKLVWLDGIANSKIIEDIKKRIQNIDIDIIDGLGSMAELIEENTLSIFPKYKQTERPDVVSRYLANGCFAIICENSPFALVAPHTLWDNFKTIDDYEERSTTSTYLRFVRYIGLGISTLISPLYLAFVTYNHTVVPATLATTIASGRQGVPFPSVIEVIALSFAMSLVREAGFRMPGTVGYFIGTLSAVLIGQSIVTAGYISASIIIVVAISTVASFSIASTTLLYSSRLTNYFLIILSGLFGIFGLLNGIVILAWHLISLRTFGLPYLYPVIPFDAEQQKDTFIRSRYSKLRKRPGITAPYNRIRNSHKRKRTGSTTK